MENNQLFDSGLKPEQNKKSDKLWYIIAGILIVVLIVLLVLRVAIFQRIEVENTSMEPNYSEGDKHWVNKVCGYTRGDVIVFSHDGIYLIKRVMAVGGDKIKIVDGEVFLQAKGSASYVKLEEPYLKEPMNKRNMAQQTIEDGKIFVMGDNRNVSSDSRSFGQVSVSKVLGKVI